MAVSDKQFERGKPVTLRAVFKIFDASAGTFSEGDASGGLTATVYDPSGVKVVDSETMTDETAAGVYSYTFQTTTAWQTGDYRVEINATHNTLTMVEVDKDSFELV